MGLNRRLLLGDLDLTAYPFSVEQVEGHGAPENVYDVLISMLANGDLVDSPRVGNRAITLTVLVEGPTLNDLALHEATLIAECERARNELTIDPGDDYAAPSVFDTFRVQAVLQYAAELEQANFRRYELTIPALPYVRGADLVVTPAQVSATETVVDDGSALSGGGFAWSIHPSTSGYQSISVVSGKVQLERTGGSPAIPGVLSRTGAVSLSGQSYLSIDVAYTLPLSSVTLLLDGTQSNLAMQADQGGGITRLFFAVPAGVTSANVIQFAIVGVWTVGQTFSIDKLSSWTGLPFIGTARQKALSLVPGGSVKTQGSIQVAHASEALGKTIVYTHKAGTGYLPPLRRWRVSGDAEATDATLVSGKRNGLVTPTDFNIPAANLPKGRVEVWARLRADSTTPFDLIWTVESWMNGTSLDPDDQTLTLSLPAGSAWLLVPIGVATMPPVDIGPSGYVRVKFQRDPGSAVVVDLDEAYLFATDEGRLTVVDCGTGSPASAGPSNRLWIDAPSVDRPNGGIYRGNAADRSDNWHAQSEADIWQAHDFDPNGASVFVATFNTIDAETSLEHHRRFHTHVAEA